MSCQSKIRDIRCARRIVVKVGTSSITHANGQIHVRRLDRLIRQLADLANAGKEVVLVSSGAVAAGMKTLGFLSRPTQLADKQAAAAVGQGVLMHMYEKLFREYGVCVGQVLLTKGDYLHPRHYLHARNTLVRLLELGAVPVVNENDTVSTEEIKIGDNDTLSAMVASIVDADALVLLSDIDGLYTANPATDSDAVLRPMVEELTDAVWQSAQGSGTALGTGGMYTKLLAADIAMNSGVDMIIANASTPEVLLRIFDAEAIGTRFVAHDVHPQMWKRRLLFGAEMCGKITVDAGCKEAVVRQGASILPVGIVDVDGEFAQGDGIAVYYGHREIARGMAGFDSHELRLIMGHKTGEIADLLGYVPANTAAIHRDHLVRKQ